MLDASHADINLHFAYRVSVSLSAQCYHLALTREYRLALSSFFIPVGKLLIGSQALGYGKYPTPNRVLPITQSLRSNQ